MEVCSICGGTASASDMQINEALELLLADVEEEEDYAAIFGPVLRRLFDEEGNNASPSIDRRLGAYCLNSDLHSTDNFRQS
jgi:hypothetical protein